MWDLLIASPEPSTPSVCICVALALIMLVWDTVEVGRNDAANLVNAVFGARIMARRKAVWLAGAGVVLGACLSSEVIDTARKGIFEPTQLSLSEAFAVYTAVYIVDTIVLYGYSAFGMPVSTTACLVFELLGASFALGGFGIVHWDKAGTVLFAIVCSVFISGVAGFAIQRAARGAIRDRTEHLDTLLSYGGWIGGGMLVALYYFMLVKGMKNVTLIRTFHDRIEAVSTGLVGDYSASLILFTLWTLFAMLIHLCLVLFREKAARWLFPALAIIGMVSMGFAFGQNDLANCASPGLAAYNLYKEGTVAKATEVEVDRWLLLCCGVLLLAGMTTRNAERVTRAEVHMGSMAHNVTLWAPQWCINTARMLMSRRGRKPTLAPPPALTPAGKRMHYDSLRACVILTVSASVIATASSFGLPVSTTYVAFAAVMATGAADRILQRADADLKLARAIWVVFSWFASAAIAAVAAGLVCLVIYHIGLGGTLAAMSANLILRRRLGKTADAQEKRVEQQARERRYPERFAEYEG